MEAQSSRRAPNGEGRPRVRRGGLRLLRVVRPPTNGRLRSRLGGSSAWTAGPRCKNAHDERRRRDRKHESGGSNTFYIADTQMRRNRAHKVEDKPDARRHAQWRPPDAKKQPQRTSKLASGQERKVTQRHADDFMDHADYTRIAANLPDAGKRRHRREEDCNREIRSVHP